MRISADKDNPAFTPFCVFFEVRLNGEVLKRCITADDEKGEVEVYGQSGLHTEVISGAVEIKFLELPNGPTFEQFCAWHRRAPLTPEAPPAEPRGASLLRLSRARPEDTE